MSRRSAGAWTAIAAACAACTVVTGLHVPARETPDAGAPDGGGSQTCVLAHPPGPSTSDARPGDGDPSLIFAIQGLTSGPDGAQPSGYDLDGLCTCAPHGESCRPPPSTKHCDGDGGLDNEARQLFLNVKQLTGLDVISYFNAVIGSGAAGFLIQVDHYNGELDDPDVTVSVYTSNGPERVTSAPVPPDFTTVQRWTILADHLVSPTDARSQFTTSNAYVAGGVLVAHLVLPFPIASPLTAFLHSGVLSANLSDNGDGGVDLANGVYSGRMPVADLIAAIRQNIDPRSKQAFCTVPLFAQYIKDLVCPTTDVRAEAAEDGLDAGCDAVSAAFGFSAAPAILGAIVDGDPFVDHCAGAPVVACDPN